MPSIDSYSILWLRRCRVLWPNHRLQPRSSESRWTCRTTPNSACTGETSGSQGRSAVNCCIESNRRADFLDWRACRVVYEARKKQAAATPFSQEASENRPSLPKNRNDQDDVLRMFLGGGGSLSSWYRGTINSTHKKFKQSNAAIPPYDLQSLRAPADLFGDPENEEPFRHAVSYGLSIPDGEGA